MIRNILTIGIGMVGEHPIGGKPKKQSAEMHPKIRKQWLIFFAAIGILAVIGAALLNTPAHISSPSLAGSPQPGLNQPVTGSGAPSPTDTGQENKICVAYNNDPPYYSCKEYKAAPTNRLKNTWTIEEIDGNNIKRSPNPEENSEKMPTIYDDGVLLIKGAYAVPSTYDNEKVLQGIGMDGMIVKNIGEKTVNGISIEITLLDLTLEQHDAYPSGIKYNSGNPFDLKPGRSMNLDLLGHAGIKKFQISVKHT